MVLECWCVVSGQVEVGLKSVASISIEVLCILNLVGTLMVGPSSAQFLFSPSSIVPTSSDVCILLSLFPSLFINASYFASMAVIRLRSISPLPFSLLLLLEASDGAL